MHGFGFEHPGPGKHSFTECGSLYQIRATHDDRTRCQSDLLQYPGPLPIWPRQELADGIP